MLEYSLIIHTWAYYTDSQTWQICWTDECIDDHDHLQCHHNLRTNELVLCLDDPTKPTWATQSNMTSQQLEVTYNFHVVAYSNLVVFSLLLFSLTAMNLELLHFQNNLGKQLLVDKCSLITLWSNTYSLAILCVHIMIIILGEKI
jgi:hypothetical protein